MGIVNYPCAVLNIRGNEPIVTNYECYSLHTFHRHLNLLNINFPPQLVARQYHFFHFPSCSSCLHFLLSFSFFAKSLESYLSHSYWVDALEYIDLLQKGCFFCCFNCMIFCKKSLNITCSFFEECKVRCHSQTVLMKINGVANLCQSDSSGVDSVPWISQKYIQ